MTIQIAKELLKELGINPEFTVIHWLCSDQESAWRKIRDAQIAAYDTRQSDRAEELCELEIFIESNGGDLHPWPVI